MSRTKIVRTPEEIKEHRNKIYRTYIAKNYRKFYDYQCKYKKEKREKEKIKKEKQLKIARYAFCTPEELKSYYTDEEIKNIEILFNKPFDFK